MSDILNDMQKIYRDMMVRQNAVPAKFLVHKSDVTRMEHEVSRHTYIKSIGQRHTTFMGIKIVENDAVLPGHIVICNAFDEVIDICKLEPEQ